MANQYLVVRTDKSIKPFILRELEQGRLRQGWGWKPNQDLRKLRTKVSVGKTLTEEDATVWRNRRLLDTEPDGVKPGDSIILPNLPEQGLWVVVRVKGPYSFSISTQTSHLGPDYGHIVPVDPVRDRNGQIAVIDPANEHVDARLRASMRNMGRMWSINALGASVDRLVAVIEGGKDTTNAQPEAKKLGSFFEAVRDAAWTNIASRYKGAEFEKLVKPLFERIYSGGRVEHIGGPGEKGADLIVYTQDALGLEYKIAVQVKLHDGTHDELHALDQIETAKRAHKVDAGVVVTTATETSDRFEKRRAALEAELAIDVRVITRDEFVELVMIHLSSNHEL